MGVGIDEPRNHEMTGASHVFGGEKRLCISTVGNNARSVRHECDRMVLEHLPVGLDRDDPACIDDQIDRFHVCGVVDVPARPRAV